MDIKSNLELLIEKLRKDGKVTPIAPEEWDSVMVKMEEDLKEYQTKDELRMKNSEEKLFHLVLNG